MNGLTKSPPGIGMQAAGKIDGDDRQAARIYRSDRTRVRLAHLFSDAGAQ